MYWGLVLWPKESNSDVEKCAGVERPTMKDWSTGRPVESKIFGTRSH
jgi:hypothetical protein